MINEQGGVNGRKINLISLDDAYSPPKTVEQIRRLVEQEQVAFMFKTLGTPPNAAIRQYLNDNKVPQLFVATGAAMFSDPQHFPWTIGCNPNYQTEAKNLRQAYLADQARREDRRALSERRLRQGLSDRAEGRPRRRSRRHADQGSLLRDLGADGRIRRSSRLQGSGADVFLIAATPKFAAQAIRKTYDLGWTPVRYITDVSLSIATVMKPAGLEKSKGLITAYYGKDPTDPRWKDDAGLKEWHAFCDKYMSPERLHRLQRRLRLWRRGDDDPGAQAMRQRPVAREHHEAGGQPQGPRIADAAAGHQDQHLARPISVRSDRMQLATFNGESWELFGELLTG